MAHIEKPKTIEELQQYCRERSMPLEKMRFFIGKDYKGAKAFGIYKDKESGKFVVYKNKADGKRAIRYNGTDETYAVNQLLGRLEYEIQNQAKKGNIKKKPKVQSGYHRSSFGKAGGESNGKAGDKSLQAGAAGAGLKQTGTPGTVQQTNRRPRDLDAGRNFPPREPIWDKLLGGLDNIWFNITFEIGWIWEQITSMTIGEILGRIIAFIGIAWGVICLAFWGLGVIVGTPDRGYYSYDNGYYYYLDTDDWYKYDTAEDTWRKTEVDSELSGNHGDYYDGSDYENVIGGIAKESGDGEQETAAAAEKTPVDAPSEAQESAAEETEEAPDALPAEEAPFTNFESTEYYSYWSEHAGMDHDDSDYSDDDSDWDFGGWDSDDTDWDSDW